MESFEGGKHKELKRLLADFPWPHKKKNLSKIIITDHSG